MLGSLVGIRKLWLWAIATLCLWLSIVGCQPTDTSASSRAIGEPPGDLLRFIPQQSIVTAVLDVSPDSSRVWRRLLGEGDAGGLTDGLEALLAQTAEVSTDQLRPWLGDRVAAAVTIDDYDLDPANGRQPGYVVAARVADSEALREFLEIFWQRQAVAGVSLSLSQDRGVPVIAGIPETSVWKGLATAIVDNSTLLVANDSRVLKQSLQTAQAPGLQLTRPAAASTFLWVSVRPPQLVDWLGVAVAPKLRIRQAPSLQQLLLDFFPHRRQLDIQSLAIPASPLPLSEKAESSSPQTVSSEQLDRLEVYLEEVSAWTAAGHNLTRLANNLQQELALYQNLPPVVRTSWLATKPGQTAAGQSDLQSLLAQALCDRYVIGQLESGAWVGALAGKGNRAVADLDRYAVEQGITVSDISIEGQQVTAWSRLTTQISDGKTLVETRLIGVHVSVDGDELFASSVTALTSMLERLERFPTSPTSARLPRSAEDMNYWYADWPRLEPLLSERRWFSLVEPVIDPWLRPVEQLLIGQKLGPVEQQKATIRLLFKG